MTRKSADKALVDRNPFNEGALAPLWDAQVSRVSIDTTASVAELQFVMKTSLATTEHVLRLIGVTSLLATRELTTDWSYTEASEVGLYQREAGFELGIVFWNEPNELTVLCREVWLDGTRIAPLSGATAGAGHDTC